MLFILTAEAVTTNPLSVLVLIINSYINTKTCGRMRQLTGQGHHENLFKRKKHHRQNASGPVEPDE
jgi:hypothetical protein